MRASIYNSTSSKPARATRRLLYFAAHGDIAMMEQLISRGASIGGKIPTGDTALLRAAEAGQIPAIKFLLAREAAIDGANNRGVTALMGAAECGQEIAVLILLDSGAFIDKKDVNGETALLKAARRGHAQVCSTLLKRGASTDVQAQLNATPLVVATVKEHIAVVRLLLRKGADPNGRSGKGPTPLIMCRSVQIAEVLLQNGAELNTVMPVYYGWTPLMMAAARGDADLVRFYLERRADVHQREHGGRTVMHFAQGHRENDEIRSMLRRAGAKDEGTTSARPLIG